MKSILSNVRLLIVATMALLVSLVFVIGAPERVISQGTGAPIRGWAWGETYIDANTNGIEDGGDVAGGIGWIDLSCLNRNVCASNDFGLSVDPTTGVITGYAWSDNLGWISANHADVVSCGSDPTVSSSYVVSGWLKAISGDTSESGGWDGCIALNDQNTGDGISYGVTLTSGGQFGGYAWGSTNVGWVSFANASTSYNTCTASTVYTCADTQTIRSTSVNTSCIQTITNTSCTAPQFCSSGVSSCLWPQPSAQSSTGFTGHLTAKPSIVPKNGTTTVYWGINNVTNCSVTNDANSSSWTGSYSATSSCATKYSTGCTTAAVTQQTKYTLSCTALDSSPYIETVTIGLLPNFEEK